MKTIEESREHHREWKRKWRAANATKVRVTTRAWRVANADKVREYDRKYYVANAAKKRERARKWGAANTEKIRKRRRRNLPTPTRPMPDLCEMNCGRKALCLDHCHVTGVFRGWLCHRCNVGLGALGDTAENLQNGLNYLTRGGPCLTN